MGFGTVTDPLAKGGDDRYIWCLTGTQGRFQLVRLQYLPEQLLCPLVACG